eukprot:11333694-Alexandrium_andersonii.AAC.1
MTHASPGVSPRRMDAKWNATTAQGPARTAAAVHKICRKAAEASTMTRTRGRSGSCVSPRSQSC